MYCTPLAVKPMSQVRLAIRNKVLYSCVYACMCLYVKLHPQRLWRTPNESLCLVGADLGGRNEGAVHAVAGLLVGVEAVVVHLHLYRLAGGQGDVHLGLHHGAAEEGDASAPEGRALLALPLGVERLVEYGRDEADLLTLGEVVGGEASVHLGEGEINTYLATDRDGDRKCMVVEDEMNSGTLVSSEFQRMMIMSASFSVGRETAELHSPLRVQRPMTGFSNQ